MRSKLFENLNNTTLLKYHKLKAKVVEGFQMRKKSSTMASSNETRSSNNSFDSQSLSSTLFLPDEDILDEEPQERVLHHTSPRYSNFYIKLPNGNWQVQCRTRDEKVISSYEIMGHLI